MKVFISYSIEDKNLAQVVSNNLIDNGLDVWEPSIEFMPGENWQNNILKMLKTSDAMVVLLTNISLNSKNVLWEIGYALGDMSYNKRVFPIAIGSVQASDENIPWILKKFNIIHVQDIKELDKAGKQISKALKERI